jgi:hypothetical protein
MTANNGKIQVAEKFRHLNPHHNLSDSIRGGDFHSIRMKGKIWKLQSGGELYSFIQADGHPLPYLDVVIVGIHPGPGNSRVYYPGAYQEDSNNPPTCASLGGEVPDPGVPIQQHKTCAGCPHDQWKPNRGGKDCKEHKRIAVVLLPYMKTKPPLDASLTTPPPPVFFKVPPASLKVWKAYTDELQARGAPFAAVITRVTFNPDKQFEMTFNYLKSLTDADADLILPLLDAAATKNILGSMPEYKQIGSIPPMDTPQETGFAAAFGVKKEMGLSHGAQVESQFGAAKQELSVPPKRGPGRPKKVVEEVQQIEQAKAAEEPAEAESETSAFEEVQDDELDSMMNQVLGSKVGKMMS